MRKHQSQWFHFPPLSFVTAAAVLLGLGVLVVSMAVSRGADDTFRLPKEVLFRGEAVVLLVVAVFAVTARDGRLRDLVRGVSGVELGLCAGIVAWTLITTLTSTNRLLSVEAFITVVAAVIIFVATRRVAPEMPLLALDLCLIPAVINAAFVIVQEYRIWNPFVFDPTVTGHIQSTALLGNPNDVGTYLVGPALAAVIGVFALRGFRRWIYVPVALLLCAGIVVSGTRAALIAFLAGMFAFALLRPWKQSLAVVVLLAIVGYAATQNAVVRERLGMMKKAIGERRLDILFSERLVPYLTAINMYREHPLTGVGPGTFKFHFMDERLAVMAEYPQTLTRSWPQNFGETHNDHLQMAAEAGFLGYALFLAGIVLVAIPLRRRDDEPTPRQRFARAVRVPLAVGFAVVALMQFPMQIAAPRIMYLTLAALVLAWDGGAGEGPLSPDPSPRLREEGAAQRRMRGAILTNVVRGVAVVVAAIAIYRLVVLPWEANHVIYQVTVRSEKALDRGGDVAIITARENIDRLKRIASVTRTDTNFYLLYAGNARMVRNSELAVEQYSAALANADHRPEIYYERGLTYLALGNLDAATADLVHAAKFNPYFVDSLQGELRRRVIAAIGANKTPRL